MYNYNKKLHQYLEKYWCDLDQISTKLVFLLVEYPRKKLIHFVVIILFQLLQNFAVVKFLQFFCQKTEKREFFMGTA